MTGSDQYQFIADLYNHVTAYASRGDVAFWVDAAKESGGPALEIGCGTGRVLIPTAQAGIDIVGLDLSPHMLAICQQRLLEQTAEVQSRVQLVLGDMRDFSLGRSFQLVTIPFRPFQHLTTVDEQRSCLRAIHRHLVTGGQLILDLFNPDVERLGQDLVGKELVEGPEFSTPDGRRVVRSYRFTARDLFNQISDVELIYNVTHPDGRTERLVHAFPMRYLFRFEAEHLLNACGFRLDHVYADYDRKPYGSKYPGELILVARKTGP